MTLAQPLPAPVMPLARAAQRMFSEQACDLALCAGADGTVEFANNGAQRLLALSSTDLRERSLLSLAAADSRDALAAALTRVADGELEVFEGQLLSSIGCPLPVQARIFKDPATSFTWLVGTDRTSAFRLENELRRLATHDPLTGLANQVLFEERVEWHVTEADRAGNCFAVGALNLGNFKEAVQVLGHVGSNTLLELVGARIRDCLREVDTVCRSRGDEFFVLLAAVGSASLARGVGVRLLDALRKPMSINGQEVYLSPAVGIAVYPDNGVSAQELLQRSEQALQLASEMEGPNPALYNPEPVNVGACQVSIAALMHAAIRQGEFFVQYQPLVDPAGKIKGCEALMRWRKADGTMVPPSDFIPVAETNGLILVLGDYVLRAAAQQLMAFDRAGLPGLYVSVNVSPRQLRQPDFEKNLRKVLKVTGIEPSRLVLEITEGILMDNPERTNELLQRLTATGIRFSLDDFGTGYSCLSYLKTFPISTLKVDRSFLKDIEHDTVSSCIVKAIIDLARAMKLCTVVEGVETEQQAEVLRGMGIDYFQGYLFSRPLNPDVLIKTYTSTI